MREPSLAPTRPLSPNLLLSNKYLVDRKRAGKYPAISKTMLSELHCMFLHCLVFGTQYMLTMYTFSSLSNLFKGCTFCVCLKKSSLPSESIRSSHFLVSLKGEGQFTWKRVFRMLSVKYMSLWSTGTFLIFVSNSCHLAGKKEIILCWWASRVLVHKSCDKNCDNIFCLEKSCGIAHNTGSRIVPEFLWLYNDVCFPQALLGRGHDVMCVSVSETVSLALKGALQ